jgi:hypothetical protein
MGGVLTMFLFLLFQMLGGHGLHVAPVPPPLSFTTRVLA